MSMSHHPLIKPVLKKHLHCTHSQHLLPAYSMHPHQKPLTH